jgi:hypothetical protein
MHNRRGEGKKGGGRNTENDRERDKRASQTTSWQGGKVGKDEEHTAHGATRRTGRAIPLALGPHCAQSHERRCHSPRPRSETRTDDGDNNDDDDNADHRHKLCTTEKSVSARTSERATHGSAHLEVLVPHLALEAPRLALKALCAVEQRLGLAVDVGELCVALNHLAMRSSASEAVRRRPIHTSAHLFHVLPHDADDLIHLALRLPQLVVVRIVCPAHANNANNDDNNNDDE